MSTFDVASTWERQDDGRWTGAVDQSWMQGRAAFGGLLAALGLRAMRAFADDRPPRSFTATMAGPVGPGPAELRVRPLRAGRALTLLRAEIWQDDELKAELVAGFGAVRGSAVALPPAHRPQAPGPGDLPALPYVEGLTPSFTRHFRYRLGTGAMPFSGAQEARVGGWCQHEDAVRGVAEGVLGLLDAWPAPVLGLLTRPAPASTVSWSTTFGQLPPAWPEGWWWFESCSDDAGQAYASAHKRLFAPDGRQVARTQQLVAIFG